MTQDKRKYVENDVKCAENDTISCPRAFLVKGVSEKNHEKFQNIFLKI